ncbi:MAG: stage 0 sporulation protein [Candidatus Omnitrophica bacterium]|nr:stage 0 sporulation protein [Candidatus Omnitrophota bacterium]
MSKLVQVQIGEFRPVIYADTRGFECKRGELVILDADRSSEFGFVVSDVLSRADQEKPPAAQGRILRRATDGDLRQIDNNRMKARDALHACISKVNELNLDMKMLTTEYSFDSTKVIFYFTAEGRIDFRDLVKEMARVFRVRIELKQIGVRDRAKMIKGYGVCGEPLCCATFIKDFGQLSIKMAKEQALPLNPSKISGVCGRIKCCMAYEYNVYRDLNRGLPKIGSRIQIAEGKGKVVNLDILKRIAHVDLGDGKFVKVTIPKDGEPVHQPVTNEPPAQGRGPKPPERR